MKICKYSVVKKIIIAACIVVMQSCSTIHIEKGTPQCLEAKIREYNTVVQCDDANVKEFTFQGTVVYVFEPGTCGADMTSEVIKSDCSTLGFLGGITGNTTINGENFANATWIRTLWQK